MKPYVLIITGDTDRARHYQKALGGVGFQVQAVTTGARAQAQLTFTTPDLIVLDMQLPDIPGEVVLRQIKACQRLTDSRLILLSTGHSRLADERRAPLRILDPAISPADLASLAASIGQKSVQI